MKEIFSSTYFLKTFGQPEKVADFQTSRSDFSSLILHHQLYICSARIQFKVLYGPPRSTKRKDEPKNLKGLREIYAINLQLILSP